MSADFASMMPDVARLVWGDPNRQLSTKSELRWGKQGSKSVRVDKGVWQDYETNEGGGVLDLVARETGQKGRDAVRWLSEHGFDVEVQQTNGHDHDATVRVPSATAREVLPPGVPAHAKLTKTYDYTDDAGKLIFQVCRYEYEEQGKHKKTFRQRRPHGEGFVWSVKGVRQYPYRVTELTEAIARNLVVFVVEGEKDAENLVAAGIPATCNAMGAGKWDDALTPWFQDADVVILPDNDDPGRKHANLVASKLYDVAKRVRVLALPALPEKGDVSDWLASGSDPYSLYDLVETRATAWTPEGAWKSSFNALPWANLDDPGPEHEWLIKGLLTRGERSMVAGESQAGKSFFTLDLALSIARGVPFFKRKTLHGGVVYQAGEGGRGLKKRLRAYRQFHGIKLKDELPFVLLPAAVDLYASDDQTNLLIDEIKHWASTFTVPLELVVIDTLSAATPGANENTSEDMSVVLARCARIAEECKCHVMLVHHMNAGGAKPRGHTSIFANLENVVTLRKVEGLKDADGRQIREATVTKQKDGEDGASIRFVLRKEVIGQDSDGEEVSSCVIVPPGSFDQVDTTLDPSIKLSSQCETLLRAIHKAIDDHGEPPPANIKVARSVRVVEWSRVREVFEVMTFEGDDEPDQQKRAAKIRQAMKRHGETLMSRQIIGRSSPYIWLTGKKVMGFRRPADADPGPLPDLHESFPIGGFPE